MEESSYQIPRKLPTYIRRLEIMYEADDSKSFHEIICNGSIFVQEGTEYDNWNGEMTGHSLTFFLPEYLFEKIGNVEKQTSLQSQLHTDINQCSQPIENEFISSVKWMKGLKPFSVIKI